MKRFSLAFAIIIWMTFAVQAAVLYNNSSNYQNIYWAQGAGIEMADDFSFAVSGAYTVSSVSIIVIAPDADPAQYTVACNIYDKNWNLKTSVPLTHEVTSNELTTVTWNLADLGMEFTLTDGGYIGVTFSSDDAGWALYNPPSIGSNNPDVYDDSRESMNFGGDPYGALGAVITGNSSFIELSGTLQFEDLIGSIAGNAATIKIYQTGNDDCSAPNYTATVALNNSGSFTAVIPPQGAGCRVLVKPGKETFFDSTARFHWLAKRFDDIDLVSGAVALPSYVPINGDTNDDNIVDAFDFAILMSAYDIGEDLSLGESDLNLDGAVDAFDFTLMLLSFDSMGDICRP